MQPSRYQKDIYHWVERGSELALCVEACPGSGKTTTLLGCLAVLPPRALAAMLAFNRSTVEELQSKIRRPRTVVKTVHALGFGALMRAGKKQFVPQKVPQLINGLLPANVHLPYGTEIARAVALAKSYDLSALSPYDEWRDMLERFDFDDIDTVLEFAPRVLSWSDDVAGEFDHDDMIRLPVRRELELPTFDYVLLDEAQDISVSQRQFIARLLGPKSRLIAVGDRSQSIYGFRGAATTSIDDLITDFGCRALPLSICYRCGRNIVDYARTIRPNIEPAENAEDGVVASWVAWSASDFIPGDMILCRNTAPLVGLFYALIAARVPARILGRDLVAKLQRVVRKVGAAHLHGRGGLEQCVIAWRGNQVRYFKRIGKLEKAAAVDDQAQILLTAIGHTRATTLDGFMQELKDVFSADGSVTLSTVHRAKGLEADRVFILDPYLMPSHYAEQDWQMEQERNIEYVAVTRAKKELYFIRTVDQRVDTVRELQAQSA